MDLRLEFDSKHGRFHMFFFNYNSIIWWIPLIDRGVRFLCRRWSIMTQRDHFVLSLSVCLSVRPSIRLFVSHTFFVVTHSFVSQATHAFLGMLPLCFRISGKRVAPCRCLCGHNKNPTKCLWHRNLIIGPSYSSVGLHIDVLSQIWLKHLRLWPKTKTSHFNSTLYVFL